jgi:hypothetical protein
LDKKKKHLRIYGEKPFEGLRINEGKSFSLLKAEINPSERLRLNPHKLVG